MVSVQLIEITKSIGKFPSVSELKQLGRNDLMCQITRRGGIIKWADRLGFKREISDSDLGWIGENEVCNKLSKLGFECKRSDRVKWPYDILVSNVLRIDVKTASYSEYGYSKGWFFRIGKSPQADLIALFQKDLDVIHYIPWYHCPTTNITLTKSGKTYERYKNATEIVKSMVDIRMREMEESRNATA